MEQNNECACLSTKDPKLIVCITPPYNTVMSIKIYPTLLAGVGHRVKVSRVVLINAGINTQY